ncbi:Oidioi.mRNA.OKI2018_I69.PAR.g9240.t1.cds [Oikopleura dioica]|uniref:Oidioi.mRNA.OKI2018_I69.PAR.g9240.t1.cds n=1 Tax=Oikopleura dioica TaxID=34765 RepID=A0ABN7RNW6_OIKDI|nr:Oidioi.mRNA.OKI2018_I69.PAR.g9240.t1.cds [Oikopleura dioica]
MGNFSQADIDKYPFLENHTIEDYWLDRGFTYENLAPIYAATTNFCFLTMIGVILLYILTWWTRRRMSLLKRLGDEPMNCWEKFSQDCKLGQEPSMNFISSTLINNDRAFVLIRVVIAIWSLTLTLNGWEGQRSLYFGSYFPMAACLTLYINFQRARIVEGFGKFTHFLNKVLSFLFNCQGALRLVVSISWWTQWLGICRYRDMTRPLHISAFWLTSKEYSPTVFMLVELLWFDTKVPIHGIFHPLIAGAWGTVQILIQRTDPPPQGLGSLERSPESLIVVAWGFQLGIAVIHVLLATFCVTKIWVFKKIPVIGERYRNREACIKIFHKRHELNKHLPPSMMQKRKTSVAKNYSNFGRQTHVRASIARKSTRVVSQ